MLSQLFNYVTPKRMGRLCSQGDKDFTLHNQKIVTDPYSKKQFDDFLTPLFILDGAVSRNLSKFTQKGLPKTA